MAGREPSASPLPLPPAYGKPTRPMAWSDADDLLTDSRVYWIASVRPDGRPHIVPSDGIWLDDALYFGAAPTPSTCAMSGRPAAPWRMWATGSPLP